MSSSIGNPILNRPYEKPDRHWRFDDDGLIVPEIVPGRRPSESWIPIPAPKKNRTAPVQGELAFEHTVERRKRNDQVDQLRAEVELWRQRGYPGVTTTSRRLLDYWGDTDRENKILFCQREAAETAIYLAEAANKRGRIGHALAAHNGEYNADLPRIAFKMATGAGKTIVMAMLIAWQTLNKVANPRNTRFAKRFLVVTPGITIRDRLRVLLPSDEENYYKARDVVPADLWEHLRRAEIVITNFHSFLTRTPKEWQGTSANTRKVATRDAAEKAYVETPEQMVTRVLRQFSGRSGEIVVLNDEAHHCYQGRSAPLDEDAHTEAELTGAERTEARDRNREAGVWFSGLQHVRRKVGIKTVYDLSATPFFLKGSGYPEGYLFPWVVSDFSLMDAIEAGVVKIPRVPVDDNATQQDVVYRNLWSAVADELPKRRSKNAAQAGEPIPDSLEGALRSLYGHYEKAFRRWEEAATARGETPPVFIVVCNNTAVSKMVYDFIAGYTKDSDRGPVHVTGELPLFSNYERDALRSRPRTILVDSAQLESGEALSTEFKKAAADEIDGFRAEYAQRTGRNADELDDTDILREVMNTVGKQGKLGENVRCVVSVSMLTEGWDANTVTHILGVRAFGSQLLCEQVVGRGLRRRSYVVNDDGFFEPEYAEVYGVPFSFIRIEPGEAGDTTPTRTPVRVQVCEDRWPARIAFPKLDGYRVETPDAQPALDFEHEPPFYLTLDDVPTHTSTGWYAGETAEHDLELESVRTQEVAFRIARRMMHRYVDAERHQEPVSATPAIHDAQGQPRRWLFPALVTICRQWLTDVVDYAPGTFPGLFRIAELEARAAERINQAVFRSMEPDEDRILPLFKRFDAEGSTDDIDFFTTKRVYETEPKKCAVNFVVLDGRDGNTWEQIVAQSLEALPAVDAYVKNDHLEFAIPYIHAGRTHRYLPDFVVRLARREDDELVRHLIVEVSGTRKSREMTREKAETARNLWCAAVNNHGGWGRWGFIEITDPTTAKPEIAEAIELLYADGPITGLPSS